MAVRAQMYLEEATAAAFTAMTSGSAYSPVFESVTRQHHLCPIKTEVRNNYLPSGKITDPGGCLLSTLRVLATCPSPHPQRVAWPLDRVGASCRPSALDTDSEARGPLPARLPGTREGRGGQRGRCLWKSPRGREWAPLSVGGRLLSLVPSPPDIIQRFRTKTQSCRKTHCLVASCRLKKFTSCRL